MWSEEWHGDEKEEDLRVTEDAGGDQKGKTGLQWRNTEMRNSEDY